LTGPLLTHAADGPMEAAHLVEVAIGDQTPIVLSMALTDRRCGEVSIVAAQRVTVVKACHDGGDAHAPLLGFEVRREQKDRQAQLRASARLPVGQRAVVGTLADADGATVEVSARVTARA
jgi:hypothetical protein